MFKVVVTLKGRKTLNLEGERVVIDQDRLIVRLSQAESAALGPGDVKAEATLAMPHGTVLKTVTLGFDISKAIRRQTT